MQILSEQDMGRIIEAVEGAAQMVVSAAGFSRVHEKEGIGNYVTDCDNEVQRFLEAELQNILPSSKFIGEETISSVDAATGWCFVVDPIDGTNNFVRALRYSSIAVGLLVDGIPEAGVVCNPFSGELYSAQRGKGAFLNGEPIHASNRSIEKSLISCGATAYRKDVTDRFFSILRKMFDACEDFRNFGSAAFDICQIAAGRLDAFFELRLEPWDYAGAMCILAEAGGCATTIDGGALGFGGEHSVLASNGNLHKELLRLANNNG